MEGCIGYWQKAQDHLHAKQADLRQEIKALEKTIGHEHNNLVHLRNKQRQAENEHSDRGLKFHKHATAEMDALSQMNEFLKIDSIGMGADWQTHLAEWLEADISVRHVELVKMTLSQIVTETNTRATTIEQMANQLHTDLEQCAASILRLEQECLGTTHTRVAEEASPKAELQEKRTLFQLMSGQLQTLEQRLAVTLEDAAPRIQALHGWIAAHEPMAKKWLQACTAEDEGHILMRTEVEAMRQDRSAQLQEAERQWNIEKQHLMEITNNTRTEADDAAAHLNALQQQLSGLVVEEHELTAELQNYEANHESILEEMTVRKPSNHFSDFGESW